MITKRGRRLQRYDLQLIMCGDIVKDSNSYLKSRGSIEDFVSFREMITSQLQGKLWLYDEVLVMSSTSSVVTYTSVYTDSEPGKVFWGADEEISDGGIPRVIVYGYDGIPMQPVDTPSPDYIPGPEEPHTPLVPQDEDEREPMFIQAHDPNYVPEPMYPEYIPLEDEHVFPAEEKLLPPVDSPTDESPGYVAESNPKEYPEEYEDDET
ncbi:hypothetical protein Tco_0154111 [Tanacetum coccineum]